MNGWGVQMGELVRVKLDGVESLQGYPMRFFRLIFSL